MQPKPSPTYISTQSILFTMGFHLDQLLYLADSLEAFVTDFGDQMSDEEQGAIEEQITQLATHMESLGNASTDEE